LTRFIINNTLQIIHKKYEHDIREQKTRIIFYYL